MNADVKIWEIDSSSRVAEHVESTNRMETEGLLEDVLVRNPDMLMTGLTLVGRQTPTDSGFLDLMGVDAEGRLVVFELKREKLTRDAVAQVIDYCSYLESLTEDELATYISDHSGKNDIAEIADFESWYGDRHGESSLRPTRMVLVGLGADSRAHAIVEFLANRGVDVSLLTFHGYQCGDRMLLARQVEGSVELPVSKRNRRDTELRRALEEQATELGIDDLWTDAVHALSISNGRNRATRTGITFYPARITLPEGVNVAGSHSVGIDQDGKIRVTFFPGAVHICLKTFQERKGTIPFETERPPNAPTTQLVSEQWYCLLDKEGWATHKDSLVALANDVNDRWQEIRRGTAEA